MAGGGGGRLSEQVIVTSAQLRNLHNTRVPVLPELAADQAYAIHDVSIARYFGAGAKIGQVASTDGTPYIALAFVSSTGGAVPYRGGTENLDSMGVWVETAADYLTNSPYYYHQDLGSHFLFVGTGLCLATNIVAGLTQTITGFLKMTVNYSVV